MWLGSIQVGGKDEALACNIIFDLKETDDEKPFLSLDYLYSSSLFGNNIYQNKWHLIYKYYPN